MFDNKIILITGAAGTIGSAITHKIISLNPKKIILLDNSETALFYLQQSLNFKISEKINVDFILENINNKKALKEIFKKNKIDFLFHAAAYKHVPVIEKNPIAGVLNNTIATKNLADLAVKYKVSHFVFFSTDKAVNPSSVMGATKLMAEKYIDCIASKKLSKTSFLTIRFGNIINSNGSVIPLFKKQLEENKTILLTDKEASRYIITIDKVITLLLESIKIFKNGDLFLFDMGKAITVQEMLNKAINELDFKNDEVVIKVVGLRPGEKLHEELLEESSKLLRTQHSEIFKIKTKQSLSQKKIKKVFKILLNNIKSNKEEEVIKTLKSFLKNYKSLNSKFQSLD